MQNAAPTMAHANRDRSRPQTVALDALARRWGFCPPLRRPPQQWPRPGTHHRTATVSRDQSLTLPR